MPDEKKITSSDDEYQFPQDEYVASDSDAYESSADHAPADDKAATEAPLTSSSKKWTNRLGKFHLPSMKNKRIIIVIAVVIVLAFIVHVLNSKTETPKPAVTQPTEEITKPVVAQSNENVALNSLGSLNGDSSDTKSKVKDLQSQLAALQSDFSQSQAADQALQKTVTQLADQINALSTQLNTALAKLQAAKTGKKLMVFHLRAVLPDRAWITSNTGETLSVTVGDHIEQYGSVQSIDPSTGVINTSSGRKIQYGTNDY
ncbi:MAG: hypothetical protein A3E82_04400 [Gammaproteobacteria bacterium RIFCSPHIGHO2_12_FULL_38_11]|nr:MAG: hypothetical protein A3E82_04400 [Gammaproteobacteria bacterium RIFCSPHIGHO2_12_FULL_38_11]